MVRKLMNRLAIVSLIGLPIAATTAIPAGASTRAALTFHLQRGNSADAHSDVPKAKIVGEGKTAVYNPTALTVAEDTSGNECSTGFISMKLKNAGTATAYVTFAGSPAFSLAAAATEDLCFYGGEAGDTAQLGLSNKKDTKTYASTLTITTSD
jgi:hypothetical protein